MQKFSVGDWVRSIGNNYYGKVLSVGVSDAEIEIWSEGKKHGHFEFRQLELATEAEVLEQTCPED